MLDHQPKRIEYPDWGEHQLSEGDEILQLANSGKADTDLDAVSM